MKPLLTYQEFLKEYKLEDDSLTRVCYKWYASGYLDAINDDVRGYEIAMFIKQQMEEIEKLK